MLLALFSVEGTVYYWAWPIVFMLFMVSWISKKFMIARITSVAFAFLTSIVSIEIIALQYPSEINNLGLFEFMSVSLAITAIIVVIFEIILAELKKKHFIE